MLQTAKRAKTCGNCTDIDCYIDDRESRPFLAYLNQIRKTVASGKQMRGNPGPLPAAAGLKMPELVNNN